MTGSALPTRFPTYFATLLLHGDFAAPGAPGATRAPNSAIDRLLSAELQAAGIQVVAHSNWQERELFAAVGGLVADCWTFTRSTHYWVAQGPAIPFDAAQQLYEDHGSALRIDGFEGSVSPRCWCNGFGVGLYHVETAEALQALAKCIKHVAETARGKLPTEALSPVAA